MSKLLLVISFLITLLLSPSPTYAHAFGQNYTLPLPVWLYLWGGAAAIIISFFVISLFLGKNNHNDVGLVLVKKLPKLEIVTFALIIIRIVVTLLLICVILSGLIGSQQSTENLAPVTLWIIFFLGITYLSAIVGNFWNYINPLYILSEKLKFNGLYKYPTKLSYTPSLLFFIFFIWLELASNGLGIQPRIISILLVSYSALTLFGSYIFGYKLWFEYADFFSVFFTLVSKTSIIKIKNNSIKLRLFISDEAKSATQILIVMFALSSTAFDGFRQTKTWITLFNLLENMIYNTFKFSPQTSTIETISLIFSPFIFLYLYILAIIAVKQFAKTEISTFNLALKFAFTLIPIAVAYNVAHYFTLLFIQGQSAISLISDPFNMGWNLFGSINYKIHINLISASTVWNIEVIAILLGHIAAVYLSHLKAQEIFVQNNKATISQIPMLILMIIYTMTGLWILSQPLTLTG